MAIPRLPVDQYEPIFRAGYVARLNPHSVRKNPYDPFEQPRQYRAWLRGNQAARAAQLKNQM
jgi:ribosome modulation factor